LGALAGAVATAVVVRWVVHRAVAKASAAERRARTAERMAEIGAMTGGLAHEIKNPLSTIGLNAQLLAEGIEELKLPDDEKGRLSRRIGALRREADRLRGILQDFLEYAGELRLSPQQADVNRIVDELSDFFSPQAERSGIRLRAELAPGPLEASVDVQHLKQALLNLMLNAVQAMTQPDTPTAENGQAPPARELILRTARESDPDGSPVLAVHVIDTGPGIPQEKLAQVFRPYFTTKAGGTGLGLPTSRRIVEAHQGRLDVISEPGRGTDFVVRLPVSRPA
jgi:signal transduction histidine kinase